MSHEHHTLHKGIYRFNTEISAFSYKQNLLFTAFIQNHYQNITTFTVSGLSASHLNLPKSYLNPTYKKLLILSLHHSLASSTYPISYLYQFV